MLSHVAFEVSLSLARGFTSPRPGCVNGNRDRVVVEAVRVEDIQEAADLANAADSVQATGHLNAADNVNAAAAGYYERHGRRN